MKFLYASCLLASLTWAATNVKVETDRVRIQIDGKPYTDFIFPAGEAMKPYLWPLPSPSGKMITRSFPMEQVPGEPVDHPHQRGLWIAHDNVNGVDFWNNEASYKSPPPRGRMKVLKIKDASASGFTAEIAWMDPEGTRLLDETRTFHFAATPKLRVIDVDSTLVAAVKVVMGDSKDGAFGMRLNPALQEDKLIKEKGKPDRTVPGVPGLIVNAAGVQHEKDVWGKPSNWVDYSGEIYGEKLGVAILDHPSNSRRARWHVRGYGLFAANPYGDSAFSGDKSKDGSVTINPGSSLHFRYRVIIHSGDANSAGIAKLWEEFSK